MTRIQSLFLLLTFGHFASAHELPHQQELNASCNSAQLSSQTTNLISLDQTQVETWYNVNPIYPVPVNTAGASTNKSLGGCNIYGNQPKDMDFLTCGEVDAFMKAALGAVNYCKALSLVPYFIGPESFVQATQQNTFGVHHQNFNADENIVFICIQACPIQLEANQ